MDKNTKTELLKVAEEIKGELQPLVSGGKFIQGLKDKVASVLINEASMPIGTSLNSGEFFTTEMRERKYGFADGIRYVLTQIELNTVEVEDLQKKKE